MLGRIESPNLAVYTVWLPVLQNDTEDAALKAQATISDKRARHYWNPDADLARAASAALHIGAELEAAWDVFLIFGPEVRWSGAEMPAPTAWMHRLTEGDPRWMRPETLVRAISTLLPE